MRSQVGNRAVPGLPLVPAVGLGSIGAAFGRGPGRAFRRSARRQPRRPVSPMQGLVTVTVTVGLKLSD